MWKASCLLLFFVSDVGVVWIGDVVCCCCVALMWMLHGYNNFL